MTQEYKKGTGTGRGGWRGGGRPKGTTGTKKENPKKMYSFRLSEEELKAVREILAKMRGKLVLLFCLLFFMLPCCALTLEGSVEYTEETARIEAFDGVLKYCPFKNTNQLNRSLFVLDIDNKNIERTIEYKASYAHIPMKLVGVVYKDDPDKIYFYKKISYGYQGVCIQIYKQDGNVVKTANYEAKSGKLISVGIATGSEEYKYDSNGKLIGYWGSNGKLKNYTKMPVKMKRLSILNNGS